MTLGDERQFYICVLLLLLTLLKSVASRELGIIMTLIKKAIIPQWPTFPRIRRDGIEGEEDVGLSQDSGFAAALVDVVLHQRDDLLKLVVQLSPFRGGVGLQSTNHLGESKDLLYSSGK